MNEAAVIQMYPVSSAPNAPAPPVGACLGQLLSALCGVGGVPTRLPGPAFQPLGSCPATRSSQHDLWPAFSVRVMGVVNMLCALGGIAVSSAGCRAESLPSRLSGICAGWLACACRRACSVGTPKGHARHCVVTMRDLLSSLCCWCCFTYHT